MEQKVLRMFVAVLVLAMAAGCAGKKAYVPADVMSQAKSQGLVQKANNFDVLFDRSDSMNTQYIANSRLNIAKDTTSQMVQTIPADLKLNSALRLFGSEKFGKDETTWLIYGMTPFNKADFLKAMDNIGWRGIGRTPIGRTLAAAGDDIRGLSGNTAIILISDFEQIEGVDDIRPKSVIGNAEKLKAEYGDRVCIYPIQVGKDPDGKKLADQIALAGKCGFAENADNLATPEAMAAYVQKVFFGAAPAAASMVEEKKAAAAAPLMEEKKAAEAAPEVTSLDTAYFDFDKYNLKPEAREMLKKDADWLSKNPDKKVVVQGNCDERGTVEYNLALGQRRADASAKYLANLGIAKNRISTVSYGKERPVCKESNEGCWAKNRRADVVLKP
jgi:OmpA-OmpF porin, OOP family